MKKFLTLLLLITSFTYGQKYPDHKYNSYVNDFANLFPDSIEYVLDNTIKGFKTKTSIEMTVVTVTSLENLDIQSYTTGLFNFWGVGKKGLNNGLMLLIAPNERKWRVEVGYGLEEYISDGYSKTKAEEILVPYLKSGEPFIGVNNLFNEFIKKLGPTSIEQKLAYKKELQKQSDKRNSEIMSSIISFVIWFLIIGIFIATLVFFYKKEIKRKQKIKDEIEYKRLLLEALNRTLLDHSNKLNKIKQNLNFLLSKGYLNTNIKSELEKYEIKLSNIIVDNKSENSISEKIFIYKEFEKNIEPKITNELNLFNKVESLTNDINTQRSNLANSSRLLTKGLEVIEFINSNYINVWDVTIDNFKLNHNKNQILVKDNLDKSLSEVLLRNVVSSEVFLKKSKNILDSINVNINNVISKKKELNDMEQYISNNTDKLGSLLKKADDSITHKDVKSSTKNKIVDAKNKIEKVNQSTFSKSNPIIFYMILLSAVTAVTDVINGSSKDIRDAESERQRIIDEEDRRRRKKIEDDRRRKQDEEDADRRRRDSYNSSYNSSSNSNWSSGSSSFGGGSSGGGGSDGSY